MRSLAVAILLVFLVLCGAAPGESSYANDGDRPLWGNTVATAGPALANQLDGHCHHLPCADGCQQHASCCAAHSAMYVTADQAPSMNPAGFRVAAAADEADGRTLLPPVPPPLA